MATGIPIDRAALAVICKRHHIRTLALFGSVLCPDFGPQSDVDVLVELEPNQTPGFLALHVIETELSTCRGGRRVDLVTRPSLNHHLRDRILASAEVQYTAS